MSDLDQKRKLYSIMIIEQYTAPLVVEYDIECESFFCASASEQKTYESFLDQFIQPLDSLPQDVRKNIVEKKNVVKIVYNDGDKLLKMIWLDNTSRGVVYMLHFSGAAVFRFNVYDLLAPFIGTYLQVKYDHLVPLAKGEFASLFPCLNAMINNAEGNVGVAVFDKKLSGKESCVNIIGGHSEKFTEMSDIVKYLEKVNSWFYKIADEIFSSKFSPSKAKAVAKTYMRTLYNYKKV